MKLTQAKLPIALLTGALLAFSPAVMAEEGQEPDIAICDGFVDTGIVVNDDIVDDEVTIDEDAVVDEEVVVDDSEVTDSDEKPEIVICWDQDWVKRGDGDETDPNIYYMFSNGPSQEGNITGASSVEAVDSANEAVVESKTQKQTPVAKVQRAAAKPTAVKANGRVFLR